MDLICAIGALLCGIVPGDPGDVALEMERLVFERFGKGDTAASVYITAVNQVLEVLDRQSREGEFLRQSLLSGAMMPSILVQQLNPPDAGTPKGKLAAKNREGPTESFASGAGRIANRLFVENFELLVNLHVHDGSF